ncbi:MAG: hypothetical protein NTY68_05440 [Candidatus Micrarchaeota archaeon]|nr:hypothetical protein [Candidatus Micrarchaeota archaeon]
MFDITFLVKYVIMPNEMVRIGVSLLILGIASYFDLFKGKNIPNNFLYASVIVSLVIGLIAPIEISGFAIVQAIIIAIVTYIFYKIGYLGGAEMFILPSLALLLPIPPVMTGIFLNVPFILFIMLFSGFLFALTNLIYFSYKLIKAKAKLKVNLEAAAMIAMVVVFSMIYVYSPIFNPAIILLVVSLGLMSALYYSYKEEIEEMMTQEVRIDDAEEEVVSMKKANKEIQKILKDSPVITAAKLKLLKKEGIKKISVLRGMPPYMPFLLAGEILALLYSTLMII